MTAERRLLFFLLERERGGVMMAVGASRARVFTATWPPVELNKDAMDETRGRRTGVEDQHNGPNCRLSIRKEPASATTAAPSAGANGRCGEDILLSIANDKPICGQTHDDGDGHDWNLVFAEQLLPMRSYNSVLLSEDGLYHLALSDCHGFMATTTTASTTHGGEWLEEGARGVASTRLSFLPSPISILFEVDGQKSTGSVVIGNFHLLPIAHTPLPAPRAPSSSHAETRPFSGNPVKEPKHSPPRPTLKSSAITTAHSAVLAEGTGEHVGRNTSGGGFVWGAVVGMLSCLALVSLVVARGWGRGAWETYIKGRESEKQRNARETAARRSVGLLRKEKRSADDDGNASDDGSTDSDAFLDGNVPDPVGLPGSEEDWRALFDTLYQDEKSRTQMP